MPSSYELPEEPSGPNTEGPGGAARGVLSYTCVTGFCVAGGVDLEPEDTVTMDTVAAARHVETGRLYPTPA